MVTLGGYIRELRKENGFSTLKSFAKETQLSISFLSDIERGRTDPSLRSLRRIAVALGVPAWQLLSCEEWSSMDNEAQLGRILFELQAKQHELKVYETMTTRHLARLRHKRLPTICPKPDKTE